MLQGENEKAIENELLGEFILDGIRPARRGEVTIEVTFAISADGIVGVSARDVATGKEQAITVTATSGLTEDELKHYASLLPAGWRWSSPALRTLRRVGIANAIWAKWS